MLPIGHFLVSILAGLGVGIHLENKTRKFLLIILASFLTACIDLDHLLPFYYESGIKILHNFFVFVCVPVALFLTLYIYERGKTSSIYQRVCLLLCVMFVGHMFVDGISGDGLTLFYPFSTDIYVFKDLGLTINNPIISITSPQVIMIFWGVIICMANIFETMTYNEVEKGEPFKINLEIFKMNKREGKNSLRNLLRGFPVKNAHISSKINPSIGMQGEMDLKLDDQALINMVELIINKPE